jgi:hypothetical protein
MGVQIPLLPSKLPAGLSFQRSRGNRRPTPRGPPTTACVADPARLAPVLWPRMVSPVSGTGCDSFRWRGSADIPRSRERGERSAQAIPSARTDNGRDQPLSLLLLLPALLRHAIFGRRTDYFRPRNSSTWNGPRWGPTSPKGRHCPQAGHGPLVVRAGPGRTRRARGRARRHEEVTGSRLARSARRGPCALSWRRWPLSLPPGCLGGLRSSTRNPTQWRVERRGISYAGASEAKAGKEESLGFASTHRRPICS